MRVTSVELHPAGSSAVAVLSYRDPGRQNPYNVRVITGLDADEIIPRYYGGSGSTLFYNLSLEKRNIVVRVALNPRFEEDESYSSLRDQLYKFISSSRSGLVQLQFKDGNNAVAAISGLITKLEAALFEKNPEIQISIRCDEPMLKALDPVSVDVTSLDEAHTIIDDPLSTAPHGFAFKVGLTGVIPSFRITDPNDLSWSFEMVASAYGGFAGGDEIHFSSEPNNKYLRLARGGSVFNFAEGIIAGSLWPILFPGETHLALDSPANINWIEISHYPTFWGV